MMAFWDDLSANKQVRFENHRLSNMALIAGILEGDRVAAQQFHARYTQSISQTVWRLLGDSDYEDVVQQVWLGVLSGMRHIEKPESLDAWVKSVTLRTVRSALRSRKLRAIPEFDSVADVIPDPNHPFKQAHIQRFYAILNRLSAEDRTLFVLRHLEGYSHEQVSFLVHYSVSTVKRRLKRARARFLDEAMSDSMLLTLLGNGVNTC